ncbi:Uncharacterised protein [uncultured archaeon]|nr:Uncharacterised protein [uncultured archaeon]
MDSALKEGLIFTSADYRGKTVDVYIKGFVGERGSILAFERKEKTVYDINVRDGVLRLTSDLGYALVHPFDRYYENGLQALDKLLTAMEEGHRWKANRIRTRWRITNLGRWLDFVLNDG